MITSRLATVVGALAVSALALTACTGGGTAAPAPTASRHPVFDQRLDRQLLHAVRQTQRARTTAFTQRLTFTSAKGDAVQTMSGRMDFDGRRGQTTVAWRTPPALAKPTRDALVGSTAVNGSGAASGSYLVDSRQIHYRAASAGYWIRYTSADTLDGEASDPLEHLRGVEAPIGGTLLESLGSATATGRTDSPTGHEYRAGLPLTSLPALFPKDLRPHLDVAALSSVHGKPVPLTVSVDGQGRITRARAELTPVLRKDGPLGGFTGLTVELNLTGPGQSPPTTAPDGPVRTAAGDVAPLRDVRDGGCVDFATGQRLAYIVVRVSCAGRHDARVLAQIPLRAGADAAETQRRADIACALARDTVRPGWLPKGAPVWAWWTSEGQGGSGKDRVTCYSGTR
ncbi:hypothetical protein [Streptomyces sp. NPDC090025]|uniref:hypothetical protein n=1 Tax=Streptomyces sp. NPDC090025 TaxID=3365922 RepID=UPI003833409F